MKNKKKTTKNSAVKKMDQLLIVILLFLILGVGGGLYFAYTNLSESARNAAEAITKLKQESAPIQNTDEIAAQNQQYADILQIAPRLTIPLSDIQSTATNDINKYARLTGIHISSTTYGKETASAGVGATQDQAAAANSIKITTTNSIPMKSVLQFIKLIENNIPIMYVAEISLEGTDGKDVKLNSMTIGVATQ